jgi:hypothetical protein
MCQQWPQQQHLLMEILFQLIYKVLCVLHAKGEIHLA